MRDAWDYKGHDQTGLAGLGFFAAKAMLKTPMRRSRMIGLDHILEVLSGGGGVGRAGGEKAEG